MYISTAVEQNKCNISTFEDITNPNRFLDRKEKGPGSPNLS